jgi:hypothetical protein
VRKLVIDGRCIADDDSVYGIAEIGHNHGGDIGCRVSRNGQIFDFPETHYHLSLDVI